MNRHLASRSGILLTVILASLLGASAVASTTTYVYDTRGRMRSATTGGVTTSYIYDAAGNRTQREVGTGGSNHNPVAQVQYIYGDYMCGFFCFSAGSVDLLTGATDIDGDTLTVSAIGTPTYGSASIISGSTVGYFGPMPTDSFAYTVSDGHGGTSTSIVYVI